MDVNKMNDENIINNLVTITNNTDKYIKDIRMFFSEKSIINTNDILIPNNIDHIEVLATNSSLGSTFCLIPITNIKNIIIDDYLIDSIYNIIKDHYSSKEVKLNKNLYFVLSIDTIDKDILKKDKNISNVELNINKYKIVELEFGGHVLKGEYAILNEFIID